MKYYLEGINSEMELVFIEDGKPVTKTENCDVFPNSKEAIENAKQVYRENKMIEISVMDTAGSEIFFLNRLPS